MQHGRTYSLIAAFVAGISGFISAYIVIFFGPGMQAGQSWGFMVLLFSLGGFIAGFVSWDRMINQRLDLEAIELSVGTKDKKKKRFLIRRKVCLRGAFAMVTALFAMHILAWSLGLAYRIFLVQTGSVDDPGFNLATGLKDLATSCVQSLFLTGWLMMPVFAFAGCRLSYRQFQADL